MCNNPVEIDAPTDTPFEVMINGDWDFGCLWGCCGGRGGWEEEGGVVGGLLRLVEEEEGEGDEVEEGQGRGFDGARREESLLTARCLRTRAARLLF